VLPHATRLTVESRDGVDTMSFTNRKGRTVATLRARHR
jgi:hypothetical protein